MIDNENDRLKIAEAFGRAIDDLVIEHIAARTQEPEITSRIGQRLEERFNDHQRGGYKIRVITADIPSRGAGSLERPMGSDLYLLFEVQDENGHATSKGVFIQAKKQGNTSDLVDQCRRMNLISKKGSAVWIYSKHGLTCERAVDAEQKLSNRFDSYRFFNRVLKCEIGDKRKVPGGHFGDRSALRDMLETIGAPQGVGVQLRKVKA